MTSPRESKCPASHVFITAVNASAAVLAYNEDVEWQTR